MSLMEKVTIPVGESGPYSISRFTISKEEAALENLRMSFSGWGRRHVHEGEYTALRRGGVMVMSDTPAEMMDHYWFVQRAEGSILINGLGIGMCLKAVLAKAEVTDVTVIEVSSDVIRLVAPHYNDPRLQIINADAYTWQPPKGKRYNAVWHDIWNDICSDNLPEMEKLHRKYGRRTDWQGSWCKAECKRR